ncbi:hypothetical protein Cni_G08792 [Canna indica]|uniref:Trehalose 6-phosphate phosphatase n=1 Tax=Canna indica TaxID=4628 RepID=A0AAQ3K2T6_9LILI|nr:hypothetical protein Cni_G08792 [Canna indica]
MDLKNSGTSPVLTDPAPISNSRLGLSSNIQTYSPASQAYSSGLYSTVPRRKTIIGKLDDVCANGWLDAMKSSSPPRKQLNKDFISEAAVSETEMEYRTWMMTYPSALTSFEHIISSAKCKKIALFLDYDGTLSPIVDNPDLAIMSNAMRAAVKSASKYFPTAIISGRSREKVYKFVKLRELYYAGSHGMDIMGPVRRSDSNGDQANCIVTTDEQGKEVHLFQPASEFLPMIDEVFSSLIDITKDIVGAKVEYNKFCVSVHYRLVHQEDWPEVARRVFDLIKGYPRLKVTHGRKVLEIRPVVNWNKGKAVKFLLESLCLSSCDDVLSIYIGDDRTDEDAFKVLKEYNLGYGILVSSVPKETSAVYSLRDTSEVVFGTHTSGIKLTLLHSYCTHL